VRASNELPRYVVISPVKDEEKYIELTLASMASQTVKPALWVIVDDGSRDRTVEIIERYAAQLPFIRLVRHPRAGVRGPGSPVIRAFEYGRSLVGDAPYEVITKLDCDLSFRADYFETLLTRFQQDSRLGIASGIYLEMSAEGEWNLVPMPSYHAFGASKVVRRSCFEEIGGFPTAAGWDTVDEIKAIDRGWRTGHFVDLPVKHHKREGSGIGLLKTSRIHGEIYYATGGDPLFFAFKVAHRLTAQPVVTNALALAYGYLAAAVQRKPRLVTSSEARVYRRLLRQRLFRGADKSSESEILHVGR
jgi:biofilm PGA synthesis N-glycosyltransferase PgaC